MASNHKTHSFTSYHEQLIHNAERTIEHSERALGKIALQNQMQLFSTYAEVIPLFPTTPEDLTA